MNQVLLNDRDKKQLASSTGKINFSFQLVFSGDLAFCNSSTSNIVYNDIGITTELIEAID